MRSLSFLGVVACLLSCAGGGEQGGTGPGRSYSTAQAEAVCEGAARHLQSCGALSDGMLGCAAEDFDESAACQYRCLTRASCDDVNMATCALASGLPLRETATAVGRCTAACVPTFTCASGEIVDLDWQCDGESDCADGSDELDCEALQCANAERCDGWADCTNGSDEEGCPTFECGRGGSVPEHYRCDNAPDCDDGSDELECPPCPSDVGEDEMCDGFMDCSDGSDETGCTPFSCVNGEQIPPAWRCDFEEDCSDGTDELGCPQRATLLCNGSPVEPDVDSQQVPPPVSPMP